VGKVGQTNSVVVRGLMASKVCQTFSIPDRGLTNLNTDVYSVKKVGQTKSVLVIALMA
jgi:hypothetical protein